MKLENWAQVSAKKEPNPNLTNHEAGKPRVPKTQMPNRVLSEPKLILRKPKP